MNSQSHERSKQRTRILQNNYDVITYVIIHSMFINKLPTADEAGLPPSVTQELNRAPIRHCFRISLHTNMSDTRRANCNILVACGRGVEIQYQWHQLSGAKSELGTTGLVIGNLLLSTSLKLLYKQRHLINSLASTSLRCHTNQHELSGTKKFALDTTQDLLAPPVAP